MICCQKSFSCGVENTLHGASRITLKRIISLKLGNPRELMQSMSDGKNIGAFLKVVLKIKKTPASGLSMQLKKPFKISLFFPS